ncbi:nSTAND1 domain-containing NTPase [Frankia tisae]|uniref:nSTAND1 domain-containing NTPase n=1 Tax=Frankia tisae TaxID=2950104 RepID=UPI0021C15798|nr:TIR domain-containing protein [Frankia tisae]
MTPLPASSPGDVPSTYDVFFSYAHTDHRIVRDIRARLADAGIRVWMDEAQNSPGDRWQAKIIEGIAESRTLAVFVSSDKPPKYWVQNEVAHAHNLASSDPTFRLFAVLLEGYPEDAGPERLPLFLGNQLWVDMRRGVASGFDDLLNAIRGRSPVSAEPVRCPYRGLRAFERSHAGDFFGRGLEITRILEEMRTSKFTAVLGASGSGKSSLVEAGVLPALTSSTVAGVRAWRAEVIRPGLDPLTELAATIAARSGGSAVDIRAALARDPAALIPHSRTLALEQGPDAGMLWVVDQFEEIFRSPDVEGRRQFVDALLHAVDALNGRVWMLLVMRVDFVHRAWEHVALARRIAECAVIIGPMEDDHVRATIVEPAHRVGLRLDPNLVAAILDDIRGLTTPLPLMEHALSELWRRRPSGPLDITGYLEIKGVGGALSQHADQALKRLPSPRRETARRVLTALTWANDAAEDTRRRVVLDDLVTGQDSADDVRAVVHALLAENLLTTGYDQSRQDETIELAHEVLITSWPTLRGWLAVDRDLRRQRQRLASAAAQWVISGWDDSELLQGKRLDEFGKWAEDPAKITATERAYIDASVAARAARLAEETRRAESLRRRNRILSSVLVMLTAAGVMATYSYIQYQRTKAAEHTSRALELAASANETRGRTLDLSLLLSLEARRRARSPAVEASLLDGVAQAPGPIRYLRSDVGVDQALAYSPDGTVLATGAADGTALLWDVASGRELRPRLTGHSTVISALGFRANGAEIVSVDQDGEIIRWERRSGHILIDTGGGQRVASAVVRRDGSMIAIGGRDGTLHLMSAVDGSPLAPEVRIGGGRVRALAADPLGRFVVAGDDLGRLTFWDWTGHPYAPPAPVSDQTIRALDITPDGATIAISVGDDAIQLWDVNAQVLHPAPLWSRTGGVSALAFAVVPPRAAGQGDHRELVVGATAGGAINIWDTAQPGLGPATVDGFSGSVRALSAAPDRRTVVGVTANGTAVVWDIRGQPAIADTPPGHTAAVTATAYSPSGRWLATGDASGNVILRAGTDASARTPLRATPGHIASLFFSADSTRLVAVDTKAAFTVWRLPEGTPVAFRGSFRGPVVGAAGTSRDIVIATPSTVGVFDLETGRLRRTSPAGGQVASMATTARGDRLALGYEDHTIGLWDVGSGRSVGRLAGGHSLRVSALTFSPDGTTLASGSDDSAVLLWDVRHRTITTRLLAHSDQILSLAFRADGRRLASTGEDHTVILWNIDEKTPLNAGLRFSLDPGAGEVSTAISFRPDGARVSTAMSGFLVVWNTDENEWPRVACALVARDLTESERRAYRIADELRACPIGA